MAAPSATVRQTPTGWKMPDGYQTLLTLSRKPAIQLWEKTVKPPGVDGGDLINTTTMHNIQWRTGFPRRLKTLMPFNVVCAYDPDVLDDLRGECNTNQTITITYPDHTTDAFFGAVTKAEPSEHKEGEFPEITVTISPTNTDPATSGEQGPVLTEAAGT